MSTPTPDHAPADDHEPDDTTEEPTENSGVEEADPDGVGQLGDAGKKALDSMKSKWKDERDRRRVLEQQLADRDSGDGQDPEAIHRQAEQAATAKANTRIVRAEIRAAAAGKLADPADALRFLDATQFEVDEDGNLDADEIADAIEDLVKSKPYLAAQGGRPRFHGTADSGARKGNSRPPQLTRDDLKRMSPEDIVKAKQDGRLDDALGLNR